MGRESFGTWFANQAHRDDPVGRLVAELRAKRLDKFTLRGLRFVLAVRGTPAQRQTLEWAIGEWRRTNG